MESKTPKGLAGGNTLLKTKLQTMKTFSESATGQKLDEKMAQTMKNVRDKAGSFFDKITEESPTVQRLKVVQQATVAEATPTREYSAIDAGFIGKQKQKRHSEFLVEDQTNKEESENSEGFKTTYISEACDQEMSHLIDKDGLDQSKANRKGKKLSIEETANILSKLQDPNDPLG